jgi:hypothetical protein
VSAWACDKGITLAQSFVGEKSNEIKAIPELLKMLNLKGTVVSIDAMGTQCEIAEQIVDAQGDYVLCVKGNQGNLHHEVMVSRDRDHGVPYPLCRHPDLTTCFLALTSSVLLACSNT